MTDIQTLHISQGFIEACYVFEIGESINLTLAASLIENDSRRQIHTKKRSSERYFGYDPAPLISVEITESFIFSSLISDRSIEYTVFDFGVVLVRYRIPINDGITLDSLVGISIELGKEERLELDARNRVATLIERIKSAITSPFLEELVNDYFLYQIESFRESANLDLPEFINKNAGVIAQILRQESEELSDDVIEEVFQYRFSYTPLDLTIIDWDATIRFGVESRDIFGVIEFALVQLLEMMYLDENIDDHHDEAYKAFSRKKGFGKLKTSQGALAQLTVDSTNLAMNVTNAINLIGDPTLVRIYELASNRFRLREFEINIEKKIRVLDGIYEKYTDRLDAKRGLILELIIVLLISIEIIQGLLKL
jgi:hypothetical protein